MTTNDHGKKIAEVWVPGEGNAYNHRYQSKDRLELELSATHHGDHDEFWIVMKRDGTETGRINPRQVTEISWANVKVHTPLPASASVETEVKP
jgi:long-subunit fatty acid transport protein